MSDGADELKQRNINLIDWKISRKGMGIFNEIKSIFSLYQIYRNESPDIVVHATIKPVIYGTIAAKISKFDIKVINLITGLGSTFIANKTKDMFFRGIIRFVYNIIFKFVPQKVVFQNYDDKELLLGNRRYKNTVPVIIPGSGVSISNFTPLKLPKEKNVSFIGRMIYEKGIETFISAAEIVKKERKDIKFSLFGPLDEGNPSNIGLKQIEHWQNIKLIKWHPKINKIKEAYNSSRLICLPSMREGMSKVLMEAGLCERAVIATNVPGCKELILDKKSGFLIKTFDYEKLASIILEIIDDDKKLISMGKSGRNYIIDNFSEEVIIPRLANVIEK